MEVPTTTPSPATEAQAAVSELLELMAKERASHLRRWCRQDLSMTTLHALLAIEANGRLTMSRLADILDVAVSNATGIVTRMEERGLVRRQHDETDRRIVFVTVTERGRQVVEDREFMRAEELRRVLEAMTEQQRTNFVRAMRDFVSTAERLRAEGRLVEDDPGPLTSDQCVPAGVPPRS